MCSSESLSGSFGAFLSPAFRRFLLSPLSRALDDVVALEDDHTYRRVVCLKYRCMWLPEVPAFAPAPVSIGVEAPVSLPSVPVTGVDLSDRFLGVLHPHRTIWYVEVLRVQRTSAGFWLVVRLGFWRSELHLFFIVITRNNVLVVEPLKNRIKIQYHIIVRQIALSPSGVARRPYTKLAKRYLGQK